MTVSESQDAVHVARQIRGFVVGAQHGSVLANLFDRLVQGLARLRVEARDGLIEDQDDRLECQPSRDQYASLLAPREFEERPLGQM